VCKLDIKFNKLPVQAIECKLDDLLPINENKEDDVKNSISLWPDEAIDYFEDITYSCSCKKLRLQFIVNNSINSKKMKPSVTLFDLKKVCYFNYLEFNY